jgi:WhiB family redox-sensing transcriptional regulator
MSVDDELRERETAELYNKIRQIVVERQAQAWREHAACKGLPVRWWFTERGENLLTKHAVAVCAECPVRAECHDYGLTMPGRQGIFGGQSMHNARKNPDRIVKLCAECGDPFNHRANTAVYCSEGCRRRRNARTKTHYDREKQWAAS